METTIRLLAISIQVLLLSLGLFSLLYFIAQRSFSAAPQFAGKQARLALSIVLPILSGYLILRLIQSEVDNLPDLASNGYLLYFSALTLINMAVVFYAALFLPNHLRRRIVEKQGINVEAVVTEVNAASNKFSRFYWTRLSYEVGQTALTQQVCLKRALTPGQSLAIRYLPQRPDIYELIDQDLVLEYL